MRLEEVKNYYQNLSDEDLCQQLNEDNTTGLSSDDLVKIVKAHHSSSWNEVNIDDHLNEIQSLIKKLESEERSKKKT